MHINHPIRISQLIIWEHFWEFFGVRSIAQSLLQQCYYNQNGYMFLDIEIDKPSILPKTLFTAPTQPWQDMPTLRTTVCIDNHKVCIRTRGKVEVGYNYQAGSHQHYHGVSFYQPKG